MVLTGRLGSGLLVAIVATAAGLPGQGFLPFGTMRGGGDDVVVGPLALGFWFPLPDGQIVDSVYVDTNGRIGAGGTYSVWTESLTGPNFGMLTGAGVICPFWTDLEDQDGLGDQVWFDSQGGVAVVTWRDVAEKNNPYPRKPFTFQAQLYPDGAVRFVYGGEMVRVTDIQSAGPHFAGTAIVGLSNGAQGGAHAHASRQPEPVDFSTLQPSVLGRTTYEWFLGSPDTGFFDLAGRSLTFTPYNGGYEVTRDIVASATPGRSACAFRTHGMTFLPGPGSQSYTVLDGIDFDPDFMSGTRIPIGTFGFNRDIELGMSFTMPGGIVTDRVRLDLHGRIRLAPAVCDGGASSEALRGSADPSICPLWTRYETFDPQGAAEVWVHRTGAMASVTWRDMMQDGHTNRNTFQAVLHADGRISFTYVDLDVRERFGRVIVGLSAGGDSPDPGESDLSELEYAPVFAAAPTVYEEFAMISSAPGGERFDLDDGIQQSLKIDVHALPAIGSSAVVSLADASARAQAALFLVGYRAMGTGGTSAPISLDGFSPQLAGCSLLVDPTPGALLDVVFAPVDQPVPVLAIPGDPVLVGDRSLAVQAIALSTQRLPYLTPSDELVLQLGY
jgi:hypothetical protein